MKNNHHTISKLRRKIDEVIRPHVPAHGKIALIDFPDYGNVGDSAIWRGTTKYFLDNHHLKPSYISTQKDFNAEEMRQAIGDDGVIFISGGGNFGDLWPHHQAFREMIIWEFRYNKIVQLPQSIHFSDKENLDHAVNAISTHSDFTLLVRDNQSLKIAQDNFNCKIELCPDMALCLGPIGIPIYPSIDKLYIMRSDKESVSLMPECSDREWIEDDHESNKSLQRLKRVVSAFLPLAPSRIEQRLFDCEETARLRVNRGINLLSTAKNITTDRLHVYIMSILMGIPCSFIDNSYGKIGAFADTWL